MQTETGRPRRTAKSRQMAFDYRIWNYATDREWEVTPAEVADGLNVHPAAVHGALKRRGWAERMRVSGTTSAPLGLSGSDAMAETVREATRGIAAE